jgi:leishmanolysin
LGSHFAIEYHFLVLLASSVAFTELHKVFLWKKIIFITGPLSFVAGSHWEKRLLMNEIMTGSVDTRSVVSAMTLALLEDSGWYKVNYSMAEQLDWGQNQGTEFLMSRCDAWNGAYHCNSTHASGCTYNREAEGYCPIVRYPGDLPVWARYFPEANRGTVMSQSLHFLIW